MVFLGKCSGYKTIKLHDVLHFDYYKGAIAITILMIKEQRYKNYYDFIEKKSLVLCQLLLYRVPYWSKNGFFTLVNCCFLRNNAVFIQWKCFEQ